MKILRIERCRQCPHDYLHYISGYTCLKTGGLIPEKGLPPWCPLHDVDPTILHLLAEKIEPGEAHDDLIKLAGYLEGKEGEDETL
jgi:hypothetical protein